MENYIGAAVSLAVSAGLFAYGYGRLKEQAMTNASDIKEARDVIDDHISKTDIHIDPARDRESQRLVLDRLSRVESALDTLSKDIRASLRNKT